MFGRFGVAGLCMIMGMSMVSTGGAAEAPDSAVENFRAELIGFFENAEETSPVVFGGMGNDDFLTASVVDRIRGMDAGELQELRERFGEGGNWTMAPEILAATLPLGVVTTAGRVGREMVPAVEEGVRFRDDMAVLAALVTVMPGESARDLGVNPEDARLLQQGTASMDPLQAGYIAQELSPHLGGSALGQGVDLGSLPAATASGVRALAAHGPLGTDDLESLERFRNDMLRVAGASFAYRESAGDTEGAAAARLLADRVAMATPEMLYVMREQLDAGEIEVASARVEMLERMAGLTGEEKEELEAFRAQALEVLGELQGEAAEALGSRIAGLPVEQLLPVREQLEAHGGWNRMLPLAVRVADSGTLRTELELLAEPEAPVDLLTGLEVYRAELLGAAEALGTAPGADTLVIQQFMDGIRSAGPARLAVLREADYQVGGIRGVGDLDEVARAAALALSLNCVVGLGSIDLPLGIGKVSLGSINFNWICDVIENAVNGVESAVASLETTVTTLVSSISDTVADIWNGMLQLPDTVKNAMTELFNLLLDVEINGYSLRDLSDPQTLQQAMGLAADYWQSIPALPDIPCPPEGTNIPGFGTVGDGDAASRMTRYLWITDQLLGLMPDTEVSLAVKIPAQLLYGGVQYLGVCLDEAAAAAEGRETETYRQSVTTGLAQTGANQAALMSQLMGVEAQVLTARDLNVRLQIERNLKAPFDDAVALFQLPASAGGYQETALDIVTDAMLQMEAAGENVGRAREYLREWKSHFYRGDYKLAYRSLQRAYRQVIWAGPAAR